LVLLGPGKESIGGHGHEPPPHHDPEEDAMAQHEATIDVDQPVRTVYDQWTQFETFPQFMDGVEEVRQLTDEQLHWKARVGGVTREWDARIVRQEPDAVVSWASVDGATNAGTVAFEPLGPAKTRVSLRLDFEPEGVVEQAGEKLGFVQRRVDGDLKRFKQFIEGRGTETGAWRGEIEDGVVRDERRDPLA
jgi:uncharacterized membrane protein